MELNTRLKREKEFVNQTLANKEIIMLNETILSKEKKTVKVRIKADGTLEDSTFRFYSGQVGTLKVRPYILRRGNQVVPLFTSFPDSDGAIFGDDDYFLFKFGEYIYYDDELVVEIENAGDYPYSALAFFTIDYLGGANRLFRGVE